MADSTRQECHLNLQIRQEGNLVTARVQGRESLLIASVTLGACNLNREVFEDFQALAIKATDTLAQGAGIGKADSFHIIDVKPDGGRNG